MRIVSLSAVLLCALPSLAATQYPAPPAHGCVLDDAHLLSPAQVAALHQICGPLNRSGVAVLMVVTLRDLGDESRPEYAAELARRWKLGHGKARSDALTLLVSPGTKHPWGMTVAVGDGLEGVITDGKSGAIQDQHWIPAVERGAPGEGILATAQALAGVIAKDAQAGGDAAPTEQSRRAAAHGRRGAPTEINGSALGLAVLAMLGILIALITSSTRRAFPGKRTGFAALGVTVIVIVALLGMSNTGAGWIALILGAIVNGLVYASIRSHKCPKDGSWMLIEQHTVDEPTYFSDGVAEVWEHCTNAKCGYERTYEKRIPHKQIVVSSSGGGGGGSSGGDDPGGGYESDSYSGGGGDTSGGGSDRD
jgi:uncharacterized protein